MWRFIGNLVAALLFAILGTLAFAPAVLWISHGEGSESGNIEGLAIVAGIIFLAVLFTPKGKGGFKRGARITAYALFSLAAITGIFGWQFVVESPQPTDDFQRIGGYILFGAPILVVTLIPVVLGLILLLLSRQRQGKTREDPG